MNLLRAERAGTGHRFAFPLARLVCAASVAAVSACAAAERASTPLQRWVLEEDLRIGSEDAPAYALSDVRHVVSGRDGRIYVAEPTEVRVFDRAGGHVRTAGRKGDGPGEYRGLMRLAWLGDTLVAIEAFPFRVTLLTADGATLSTRTVRSPSQGRLLVPGGAIGVLRDGSLLMAPMYSTQNAHSVTALPIYRVRADGRAFGTLGHVATGNGLVSVSSGAVSLAMDHPLPSDDLPAVAPDGSGVVIVERGPTTEPDGAPYRVIRLGPTGDTLFARRYDYVPLPVSRAAADSLRRKMGATLAGIPRTGSLSDAIADALDLPAHQPPVTALVVATDGSIWLRREALGRDPVPWTVLAADGDPLATIDLPAGLVLHHISERTALGVVRGEDDVPLVVRYRIDRGGR